VKKKRRKKEKKLNERQTSKNRQLCPLSLGLIEKHSPLLNNFKGFHERRLFFLLITYSGAIKTVRNRMQIFITYITLFLTYNHLLLMPVYKQTTFFFI
jgi:hypothetical protein